MGHPQDLMDTAHGMPPLHQPKIFRQPSDPSHGVSSYPNYQGTPLYHTSSQPPGYPQSQHVQPPPKYMTPPGVNHERRPVSQWQSPAQPRSSGFAVVIPSPQTQRTSSTPMKPSQPKQNAQVTSSTRSGIPTTSASPLPPVDYQLLLLSLAEDYLAAAHGQGSLKALVDREINMRHYYKLVATGLSCLEVVLKRFKLQPQMEANVRLRYASVLYDETKNMREAEQTLSEGIKMCDRYRLLDFKYNMEYLLALVLFEGSPRASLKFLDGVIKTAEAYKHNAWVYGLRFLKVSLLLKLSSHQDVLSALTHIRSISGIAEQSGDKAILALASTVEALVHLRGSTSAESIEQAQRSLATARSLQLDAHVASIPQVVVLTNIVDLACSLQQCDPSQAVNKMQAMHASLESQSDLWHPDGTLLVPVHSSKTPGGHGLVRRSSQGALAVTFHWTPWEDIYALGFLLSSIATAHKNTSDGLKSEQMLKEGIRRLDGNNEDVPVLKPISSITSRHMWRQNLKRYLQTHLVFALCTRTAWKAAQEGLQELQDTAASFPQDLELLDLLIQYLDGVIKQGIGDLDDSLSIFQRPHFSVTSVTATMTQAHLELAILSTFNSILIIRDPSHPSHHLLPPLLSSLEPHLPHIKNSKPLTSAYNLILATSPNSSLPTIPKTKQYIHTALSAAKAIANNQLLCVALSLMSDKFFKGVVGGQSEKSARASETMARKAMDALWRSVGAGIVGDTMELAGRGEEAEKMRDLGREIARGLPEGVVQWEDAVNEDVDMR